MSEPTHEVHSPHLTPKVGETWLHRDGDPNLDCEVRIEKVGSDCPCPECNGHPDGPVYHVKPSNQLASYSGPWGVRRWMLRPKPEAAMSHEFHVGDRVKLVRPPNFKELRGRIVDIDPDPGKDCRWMVHLDDGSKARVPARWLAPEPPRPAVEPRFRVGDHVRAMGSSGMVEELDPRAGMLKVRIDPTLFRWVSEDDVIAAPPKPRFEPGQRVRISGMANEHWNGLEARIVRLELDTDPDGKDGWWRVEFDSGGIPEVNSFHHSKLEPIADRHHDGQANTSGIELGPAAQVSSGVKYERFGGLLVRDPALDEFFRKAMAAHRDGSVIAMPREAPCQVEPSLLTVLEGVHRWQQADTVHRRAHVSLSGHTATVHVTTLPDLGARRVKFCSAYSAEEVVHILDDLALVAAAHPDMEFKMARHDVRFAEDTGEAD